MTPATKTTIDEEIRPEPVGAAGLPECDCPHDCERDHENE
jgi:hypothetical protein